jgi:transposase InsO family protein
VNSGKKGTLEEEALRGIRQEAGVIERIKIIEAAREQGVSAAARHYGCSRTTVYALLRRHRQQGLEGLLNQPRGPRLPMGEDIVELIVACKLHGLHRSTAKIQQLVQEETGLRVSRQSVWRVLSGRGLARLTDREPLHRFERPQANDLWQMDLKEDVSTPAGKAHLLAMIDDSSRFCLGGEWIASKGQAAVLGALAKVLRQWGLPQAILTDRATVFYGPATAKAGLTTYQLALEALGVTASFAKAYKPRTKGKVEKFIQFVIRDFLKEVEGKVRDVGELNQYWQAWLPWYNERRPHASLGDLPPARRFHASARPAPAELERLLQVEVSRRGARDCSISVQGKRYAVPADLIGRHVWVGVLGNTLTIEHAGKTIATYTT